MSEMSLLKIDGKPIEKLIEVVSAGIGTLYRPTAIKKEADAEAYRIEKIAEAQAKGLVAEHDIITRARERFVNQEVNRQINIEATAEKSIKYLKETVSEQPIDADWRTKFFSKVQDISNDEMQEIWAKILAEEVFMPGRVNLRTLDVLSNLNKHEARVFQKAASISFENSRIMKVLGQGDALEKFGLTYSDLLTLRAAGLLFESDTLNVVVSRRGEPHNCGLSFFGTKLIRIFFEGDNCNFNQLKFTPAGGELLQVLEITHNYDYLNYFVKEESKRGYKFEIEELEQS